MIVALWSGLACAPAEETPPRPSAWSWQPPPDERVLLTPAELEVALDETIAATRALRPRTVTDAFDAAMTHREEGCPAYETNGPQTAVAGDCTTADGWAWYGVGQLSHIEDFHIVLGEIDAWHRVWDYSTGNVRVVGPDARYELLGYSWYRDYDTDAGARAIRGELWGEFEVEGDGAFADGWIARDRGVELYVDLVEAEGGWDGTWTVGVSRLDGVAWAYVYDFALSSAAGGCTAEPAGAVEILDAAGTWYEVAFDGDVACDGCGAAAVDGAPLGEVCADFSALARFDVDPWEG